MQRLLSAMLLVLIVGSACSSSGNSTMSDDSRPAPSAASGDNTLPTSIITTMTLPVGLASAVVAGVGDGTICNTATEPRPQDATVVTAVAALELVAVPCETFAYNRSWQLAIYDGNLHAVVVPAFDVTAGAIVDSDHVLAVGFAPSTTNGEFEAVSKARGAGGCGEFARYRLVGNAVVLVVAKSYECPASGEGILNPYDWPTVYTEP